MTQPPTGPVPPSDFYRTGSYKPMDSVGFLMRRVLSSILQEADAELAVHDLTYVQWLPLYKLLLCSDVTSAGLARDLGIDPAAVTRALDRLQAKGMLRRERSTTDRRVLQLVLTDAGRLVASHVPKTLAGVLNAHLAGFTHEECELLLSMLRRMLHNGDMLHLPIPPPDAPAGAPPGASVQRPACSGSPTDP